MWFADKSTLALCMDNSCSIPWGNFSIINACSCMSFLDLLQMYLVLLLPGIIVYLVLSFRESK